MGVHRCAWVCVGVHGCVEIMNCLVGAEGRGGNHFFFGFKLRRWWVTELGHLSQVTEIQGELCGTVMGWITSPPNLDVGVLTTGPKTVTVFGEEVKMRIWVGVSGAM